MQEVFAHWVEDYPRVQPADTYSHSLLFVSLPLLMNFENLKLSENLVNKNLRH
jgi:hypothetical protein